MSGIKQIDGYKVYLSQQLGHGSYGDVYIGINDQNSEKVAVKIIKKSSIDNDEYLKAALYSQIKIMQSVKSQNIVGFFDVMESSKNYYIVQELCDGDISKLIKPKSCVPQKQARQLLFQICNGFLALVREGIIHRDLKPANIMVKGTTLKIGDFGFAKKTHGTKVQKQTIVGTPLYMSPQILKSQPYSSKCDIWALGFLFYEMLHGKTPWTGTSQYNLIKNIETKPLVMNEDLSNETKDFLRRCLQAEEKQRISWDELFVHQIFGGVFLEQASENKEFENKLKCVMADLRFQINSQNLDLFRILTALGYKSGDTELDQDKFYQFLKIVNPELSREESNYIFGKADTDHSNGISIQQIQALMRQHCINLTSVFQSIPNFQIKRKSQKQISPEMTASIELKVRNCFIKLFHIINNKNKILYDVFQQFDKEKCGSLDRTQFKRMMNILSKDLGDDQINGAFGLIDEDGSNSIQFDELNSYFSKVNGIPEHLNRPAQICMDIQKTQEPVQQMPKQTSQPQIQPMNMFVQPFPSPNQYGGFQQQPNFMPQPPQYGYNQQPNMYGYQGYQQQPPPPQGGFFNNFVMNQLQMGMNQSHQNPQGPPNRHSFG